MSFFNQFSYSFCKSASVNLPALARAGKAEIDIQLKTRNLSENGNWQWVIFKNNEELDTEFYNEPSSYLFLVGIKLVKRGIRFHQVIWRNFPQIALIPGSQVVKYFKEKSLKRGVITLSPNKVQNEDNYFRNYFGEENIWRTLLDAIRQQEKEN